MIDAGTAIGATVRIPVHRPSRKPGGRAGEPAFLRRFVLALAVLIVTGCAATHAATPPIAKPNVLVFLTDDLDFGETGAFDPLQYPGWEAYPSAGVGKEAKYQLSRPVPRPLTPNIDRFVAEGVSFTQFRVASPMCVPSRYALLTGQLPSRASGWSLPDAQQYPIMRNPGPHLHLEPGQWQLAQAFKSAGYTTGLIGKWHLAEYNHPGKLAKPFTDNTGKTVRPGSPDEPAVAAEIRASYEAGQRYLRETQGFDYVEALYIANTNALGLPLDLWQYGETSLEWITAHTLRFLDTHAGRPFFLWVAPNAPHGMRGESFMRNPARNTASGRLAEDPVGMPDRDSLRQRISGAGTDPETSVSTWIDDSFGAILQRLEKLGLAENTIVVFTSDHQSHGKWTCYDGARVPFVVRWKGRTPAGSIVDTPVSAVDLAPTLLELSGLAAPERAVIDGRSMAAALTGGQASLPETPVFVEFGYGRAIVEDGWKYIALRFPPAIEAHREKTGEMPTYYGEFDKKRVAKEKAKFPAYSDADQLFDLRNDMLEQRNLAADPAQAARLADLKAKLGSKLREIGIPFGDFVSRP